MGNSIRIMALGAALAVVSGCASALPQGVIYTGLKLPVAVTGADTAPMKTGKSSCTSVLILFATGDCSIEKAAKNGGITKVHHVDWDAKNFLGIYGSYTLTVYGD